MSSTFTVEYCHNCDGGGQEYSTAESAILAVYPSVKIIANRKDEYPIIVTIRDGNDNVIWTDRQQHLFRRNPDLRSKSIETIKKAVAEVK